MDTDVSDLESMASEVQATLHEGEDDKPSFEDEDLRPMLEWVADIIEGLLPGEDFDLEGDQNRDRIRVKVRFHDESKIGLFMGHKRRCARSLMELIRFQQLCPHNRYIMLEVVKENDENDIMMDRNVFTGAD